MSRPIKILLGMVLGLSLGLILHWFAADALWVNWIGQKVAQPVGQVFLRLILAIVVPLVFSSLVLGIIEIGDLSNLGRIGLKTFGYTLVASSISVGIGLSLVSWLQPGIGFPAEELTEYKESSQKAIQQANTAQTFPEILVGLIPKNPISAAAHALEGEMIALMVFALLFGVAISLSGPSAEPVVRFLDSLRHISMRFVDMVMAFAPVGVFALMFALSSKFGWAILFTLGKFVLVVLLGLAIQQFIVYGIMLKFLAGRKPFQFWLQIREVILTAFATASSNATLPTTLRVATEELGINRKIGSFVLTIGSTANQNGTALFEGVTILFLAQVFNVDLSLGQQIIVLLMAILAGIGTAGVPGGSIPLIVIVLQSVGIPPEGIGIILGVDRILDMCRTVLNVTGDMVAAAVVDYSEQPV